MTPDIERVFATIDAGFEASIERLADLLRIPSIGTDPNFDVLTRRAADWLANELSALGFEVDIRPTAGQPAVVAHDRGAPADAPHLLYYGHYDVQPPDPLALWESGPFEPVVRDGPRGRQIVARGAVDNKGQLMTWLEAFRAWRGTHGAFPVRVSVLVEGEEESGSPSLAGFLDEHRVDLHADICVISDTGMLDVDRPSITTMLRGIAYFELTLHGPSRDLHSGGFGGAVVNPINGLCALLAALHDADARVTIPGFYDRVAELSAEEAAAWRAIGFDEASFLKSAGLDLAAGEAGRTTLEKIWSRPTCDVNGIWGGYTGDGSKTVIASHASAKLSFRLVPDQRPDEVVDGLKRFIAEHTPPGCRVELTTMGLGGPIRVPTETPFMAAAYGALQDAFGAKATPIGCGGSIPVVALMREVLGIDSLLIGFGLNDDQPHSPNEKFDLVCLERGIKTHAALLAHAAETIRR